MNFFFFASSFGFKANTGLLLRTAQRFVLNILPLTRLAYRDLLTPISFPGSLVLLVETDLGLKWVISAPRKIGEDAMFPSLDFPGNIAGPRRPMSEVSSKAQEARWWQGLKLERISLDEEWSGGCTGQGQDQWWAR